jgi:hypothetical protein
MSQRIVQQRRQHQRRRQLRGHFDVATPAATDGLTSALGLYFAGRWSPKPGLGTAFGYSADFGCRSVQK